MKVIKKPTVITTEETCKNCGAVLELNPWDYKEETRAYGDVFDYYYCTVKRKWYVCPCCHAVNVVKTLVDGKESEL